MELNEKIGVFSQRWCFGGNRMRVNYRKHFGHQFDSLELD
jgi:hypothetical protein